MNFVGIVGTNASFSYNRKFLWYMKKHFSTEANIEIQEIAGLPLFSEGIKEIPVRIREIARSISESDGVIFATPEYDHSITAGLKSLLEWLIWGDIHPLTNLPVMVVGVSLGNMGTVFAQENLKQILDSPGLDAFVLPGNQFLLGHAADSFDEEDKLKDSRTVGWLEHCFTSFMNYSESVKSLRSLAEDRTKAPSSATNNSTKKPEAVKDWQIEKVNLGLPSELLELQDIRAEKLAMADFLKSEQGTELIESGDGWWIEKRNSEISNKMAEKNISIEPLKQGIGITLDASTGASKELRG